MLRSCYASTWRFPGIGDVEGEYFFNPTAAIYEGWNFFGSRNWHQGDGTPDPTYGEMQGPQRYRKGNFPAEKPKVRIIGTREMIAGDEPIEPPFRPGIFGLPLLCWDQPPGNQDAEGGIDLGAVAAQVEGGDQVADGGIDLGAVATQADGVTQTAEGGSDVGGIAAQVEGGDQVADGGSDAGGVATQTTGGGTITTCGMTGMPLICYAHITGSGPLVGNYTLTWGGAFYSSGTLTAACSPGGWSIKHHCHVGIMKLDIVTTFFSITNILPDSFHPPPVWIWNKSPINILGPCSGVLTVVINETP